ncbi:MAG: hypothetical protein Q8K36_01500, partial [Alphaproteobacteria bacterium]|nr:hypothetical protein [Alphaproteobacteria bacterium]
MKKFQNNVLFALMAFATQEACASGLWGNLQSAAKNVLNTHGQQGQAAGVSGLTQGISAFAQTRNFDDLKNNFVSGAQQGFSQANLKKQADQLILEFFDEKETPTTTVAQKKAIQNLYSSQEYQQIINVIEQTNDIYIMLSKTADKVKNDNQATLMQMGDAIQNVDDTNIALVTQKIHDFVTSIAPAGSSKVQSSDGLSKEEVEAIVLEVIQENYGDLLQWVQQAMERERMQRNSQANNPFLPSNVGT